MYIIYVYRFNVFSVIILSVVCFMCVFLLLAKGACLMVVFFCILSETDICIFIDTDAPCDLGWLDCGWFRIFALLYIRGARVTSV